MKINGKVFSGNASSGVRSALATAIRANLDLMVAAIWSLVVAVTIFVKYGDRLFG